MPHPTGSFGFRDSVRDGDTIGKPKYAAHGYAWTTGWSNDTLDLKELRYLIAQIPSHSDVRQLMRTLVKVVYVGIASVR